MADDARVIQGIDWRRTFPFTHLFRSFLVAIHPSKLFLSLLALVLVYAGGRVLDSIWPKSHWVLTSDKTNEILAYQNTHSDVEYTRAISGLSPSEGPFAAFWHYETSQVHWLVSSVRNSHWVSGPHSIATSIRHFIATGPSWAFTQHPVYFVIFGLWFLVIWSIFGGAVARIAAVHVARDEKLSIRQALRFSVGKLLSFLFAPVIPLLIVLVVGLVVTVGGLIGNIPYIGPIAIGVFFFLALAAGFVMTLVMLGTIGGFNLMYPTIAVEGSDSFDAISRSFSYLYARPWRMAFYTLVTIVYGAICYLFVRLFIWLLLAMTHYFVDLGMFTHAAAGADLFSTMWPSPVSIGRLAYDVPWDQLNWGEKIGAGCILFWVYLCIAMLGAFAISFYFSANTIIYYLMRQEVDATEMDDVYVEQSDEEFADAALVATATVQVTETVVTQSPPPAEDSSGSSSPPAGGAT